MSVQHYQNAQFAGATDSLLESLKMLDKANRKFKLLETNTDEIASHVINSTIQCLKMATELLNQEAYVRSLDDQQITKIRNYLIILDDILHSSARKIICDTADLKTKESILNQYRKYLEARRAYSRDLFSIQRIADTLVRQLSIV